MFTKDEQIALRLIIKHELKNLKEQEKNLLSIETNSPFLGTVLEHDSDLPFLASAEAYRQLLEELDKKLDKEWKKH